MPRYLDRDERLDQISEAAWRVVLRDGLEALSVRNVAAEAGMAPSSMRYVFPTQAALRQHATERLATRMAERVWVLDATSPTFAVDALLELLPLDEKRRMEMEVYLALGTAAMTDESLQETHRVAQSTVREICAEALRTLGRNDELEIAAVHALIDGLALHLVRQSPGGDTDWAVAVVNQHLATVRR
ncbi:TetR family transcriptional regulator C-terminal domain-containing protein [Ammonicoccus fulvus]|uniref:TetR family transcriptional regulator C-terminal domain-containing protein n=1 Tax=Ammonicoccus fulvus TaxID=3138240 RepID=A0ABZ3FQ41_9ACTN